jgi:hypothetical protein
MKESSVKRYRKTKILLGAAVALAGLGFVGIRWHEYSLETAKKAAIEAMLHHVEDSCGLHPQSSGYEIVIYENYEGSISNDQGTFKIYNVSALVRLSGNEIGKLYGMVFTTLSIFGFALNGTDIVGSDLKCKKVRGK